MNCRITLQSAVARIKQPEYTGENRCVPCTVLNLALGSIAAIATVVLVVPVAGTVGVAVGLSLFVLSVLATYFRGYFIPGTPTITKRYFPDWALAAFGKDGSGSERPVPGVLEPEKLLLELGIVVNEPGSDLRLDATFAKRWTESIQRYRGDERAITARLGEVFGVAPEQIAFEYHSRSFAAWVGDRHLASWPSSGAAVADAAAAVALSAWDAEWNRRPLPAQMELLGVLRLFLDTCPTCDGSVALSRTVSESCCRSSDVVAATCRDCDDRLFEMDIDPDVLVERN
jgi:hypothetical protein